LIFLCSFTDADLSKTFIEDYANVGYENVLPSAMSMFDQLRDFPSQKLEYHLSSTQLYELLDKGDFAVLCAWPRGQVLTKEEISFLEKVMERYFECRNLQFVRADGYYDGVYIPNSYIVLNPEPSEMISLAKSFAQVSMILARNGEAQMLNLLDGTFYAATTWSETPLATQNYTEIKAKDRIVKFTFNFALKEPYRL